MFYGTPFNSDISSWDVSSVTSMHRMLKNATSFNQDISSWDISNVTDMMEMFYGTSTLSDANKCAINQSFSSNDAWPYDWNCFVYTQIAAGADGGFDFFVEDLDGDGDLDILNANFQHTNIVWYENDGAVEPTFSSAHNIDTSCPQAISVFAADIDGDGDMDVLSACRSADTILWYENDGASDPSWSTGNVITTDADGVYSIFVADLDGDGDLDVTSTSENDDKIAWYENDGAADPSWVTHDIDLNADGAWGIFVADMDADGDMDILSSSYLDDTIAWYENDGAADPTFNYTYI